MGCIRARLQRLLKLHLSCRAGLQAGVNRLKTIGPSGPEVHKIEFFRSLSAVPLGATQTWASATEVIRP
jgi:hypothetical protein